ncbi:polymorphic toxin-type HINT domain-containing protein [Streptomyces sp. ISL-36]|uniref:polymorphic toxin-type HINT domain-containing protein n=1 Tax=Streptomyces sp. ISL-36 TaxID=2819182 RepID=UPI0027E53421|nr:polymorphic toxin-type HINT domain-containing protein [Streptomyces sp. ISL-36]
MGGNAAAPKKATVQDAAESSAGASARADEPSTGNAGTTCSFSPETPVLMENGSTKPIAEITAGDKVEAADEETGEANGSRTVVATWAHDDSDLIDLTVRLPDGETETIHTTAEHPFWDTTTHTWVPAGGLAPGHALSTPDSAVYVVKVQHTPGTATRYNLTVNQLHTFYVLAGATPVLVHNHCGRPQGRSPAAGDTLVLGLKETGDPLAKNIGGMTLNHDDYGTRHPNADGSLGNPQWVNEVNDALKNDRVSIAVDLGGVLHEDQTKFTTPAEVFAEAYRRGVKQGWQKGPGTQWEMSRVGYHSYVGNQEWSEIAWYLNGKAIAKADMPEPDWGALRTSAGQ